MKYCNMCTRERAWGCALEFLWHNIEPRLPISVSKDPHAQPRSFFLDSASTTLTERSGNLLKKGPSTATIGKLFPTAGWEDLRDCSHDPDRNQPKSPQKKTRTKVGWSWWPWVRYAIQNLSDFVQLTRVDIVGLLVNKKIQPVL